MCGIAGLHIKPRAKGKIPAGKLMDWLLLGIEHRGKDATGYLSVGFDHNIVVDKTDLPATDFIKIRKPIKRRPQTILAHTRAATQGSPSNNANNHPVQYGTVFLTHNGWLMNDAELFTEHDLEVTAEVDTLAIAAMLWDQCDGAGWANGTESALKQIEGAMAVAAIDATQPGEVLLARGNSSPLYWIETKDFFMWASTVASMQKAWGKVLGTPPKAKRFKEMDEGRFMVIKDGEITFNGEFTPKEFTSNRWGGWYGSGSYDYAGSYDYSKKNTHRGYYYVEKDKKGGKDKRVFKEYSYVHGNYSTPISRTEHYEGPEWSNVLQSERKAVEDFYDFAVEDNQFHEVCIWLAADELEIDVELAKWLMFYGAPDLVDNLDDDKIINFRVVLERKYKEWYDQLVSSGGGQIVNGEVVMEDSGIATVREPEKKVAPWKISDVDEGETMLEIAIKAQEGNVDSNGELIPTTPEQVIAGLLGPGPDEPPHGVVNCLECNLEPAEIDGYCESCINYYKQVSLDNIGIHIG